jgi:hypothetical protein
MNLPGLKPWVSYGHPGAQACVCNDASREIFHLFEPKASELKASVPLKRDSGLGSSLRQGAGYSPKVE